MKARFLSISSFIFAKIGERGVKILNKEVETKQKEEENKTCVACR